MRTEVVAVREDQLVPLADMRALTARLPDARLHEISSLLGHDAFLKEAEQLRAILSLIYPGESPLDRSTHISPRARCAPASNPMTSPAPSCRRIHLSSTYAFRGYGDKRNYDYSRSGNPTRDLLGNALADLEGGAGGVITGTGMGAITLVGHLLPQGARIVAPHDCYGGTFRLFTAWNKRNELKVDFVRFADEAALDAALAQKTDLLWIETPSNPLLRITDIAALVAEGARASGTLVVVDNTFLSPAWQQPLDARCRHRRALHHQVHQRPQRCGRRRGDRRDEGTARAAGLVGQLPGTHGRRLRQLPDAARPAHAARRALPCMAAMRSSWPSGW